jgi:hypothetical protein
MPAPKRANNTAEAVEANRRRGDRSAAERLRERGWLVVSPEMLPSGRHVIAYTKTADGPVVHDVPE